MKRLVIPFIVLSFWGSLSAQHKAPFSGTSTTKKSPPREITISREQLFNSKTIWDVIPELPNPIPSASCQVVYTNEGKQVKIITLTNYHNIHDPVQMKYARSFHFEFSPGLPPEKRSYSVIVK